MTGLDLGNLYTKLAVDYSDLVKAQSKASQFAKSVEGSMNNAGKALKNSGKNLTKFATLPLAGFAGFAVKAAADFESSMNRVGAVTNASASDFEALEKKAKSLGATTAFSASQAAEGMNFLGMAGFDTKQIIDSMSGTLQLAAAANIDLGAAADTVSNILSGYGLEVNQLGRANDVLVKTFTRSNTDLLQLGEALKYVGPIAKSAGVEFEEVAAAIGILGNAGIQGSMAGTSLRNVISRVLSPTKEFGDAAKAAGLSFTDSTGKILPFVDIVKELEPHANDAGLMLTLFGDRAGPAMAALVGEGADSLSELQKKLIESGGTAEKIADSQMKGLNGVLKLLASTFESLQLAIADSGLLQFATEGATEIVKLITSIVKANPAFLKMGVVIAATVAAAGPLLFIMGTMVTSIGALVGFVGTLGASLGALSGFALPVVAALAAIGAGAYLLYDNFDEVKAFLIESVQTIKETFATWVSENQPVIDQIIESWNQIKESISSIFDTIASYFAGENYFATWFESIGGLTGVFDIMGRVAVAVIQAIANGFKFVAENIGNVVSYVKEKLLAMGAYFMSVYTDNKEAIDGIVGKMFLLWNTVKDVAVGVAKFAGKVLEYFNQIIENLGGWDNILEFWGDIFSNVLGVVTDLFSTFITFVTNQFDNFSDLLDGNISLGEFFANSWSNVADLLKDIFVNLWDFVKKQFNSFIDFIKDIDWSQMGVDMMQGLADGIKKAAMIPVDQMKTIAGNIKNGFTDFFNIKSPSKVMQDMGVFLMEGLGIGIDEGKEKAITAIISASSDILKAYQDSQTKGMVNGNFGESFGGSSGNFGSNVPSFAGGAGGLGSVGDTYDSLQGNASDLESEQLRHEASLELLKQAEAAKLEAVLPYHELREIEERNHQKTIADLEAARFTTQRTIYESTFDSLMSLSKNFAGKQSGIYKGLFAASKAFAIAEAAMALQVNIAQASKKGFPENIPFIAGALSQGASIVNAISSITSPSTKAYNNGGYIPSNAIGMVGEGIGPELVSGPANVFSTQNTKELLNSKSSSGETNVSIEVFNYGGSNVEVEESSEGEETRIKMFIDRVESKLSRDTQSGGGTLIPLMEQTFGMQRVR